MTDHYQTLGVPRDATPEQIKQAFRDGALKYHPDRNRNDPAAEAEFKRINEAYSVLSDPEKKSMYDAGGYTAETARGPMNGENPYGQYTWTWTYTTERREPAFTRKDSLGMLFRSLVSVGVGVMLFRYSYFFGMIGVLICLGVIGSGIVNSFRAIILLSTLKK